MTGAPLFSWADWKDQTQQIWAGDVRRADWCLHAVLLHASDSPSARGAKGDIIFLSNIFWASSEISLLAWEGCYDHISLFPTMTIGPPRFISCRKPEIEVEIALRGWYACLKMPSSYLPIWITEQAFYHPVKHWFLHKAEFLLVWV